LGSFDEGEKRMNIDVESFKRVDLITVAGRVDSSNAGELEEAFNARFAEGRSDLVVNLAGIDFMASSGLRALVAAWREAKKRRGDMVIAAPSERMMDVLRLAGLNNVFTVYEDDISAVASF
jgi:anti-sigma B factor antagonist